MNSWINLNALWKIMLVGLLAGAGLPALFAVGLRALYPPGRTVDGPAGRPTAGPLGYTAAVLCFAVVLAAIGWGIYVIVNHS
ncbi:hypothetical protein GCM10010441_11350 [Kitasatospora paracochleata]|uniref:Uncharacterized protein n=1 Tax=Kitasatospora paracochleata TaxID=58354 RepID=A0ABT1J1Y5_9ACTN|nr:hypothetical protein [Kitasatospora paracochleata]MCP2311440.1 hypothetical protein [Kitasatospora paracochleata]